MLFRCKTAAATITITTTTAAAAAAAASSAALLSLQQNRVKLRPISPIIPFLAVLNFYIVVVEGTKTVIALLNEFRCQN